MNSQKDRSQTFYNPLVADGKRTLWQVLLWFLGYYKDPVSCAKVPEEFTFPFKTAVSKGEAILRWIGHSTFLIEYRGKTVLLDPVWAKRASPFSWIGPKRHLMPAIPLDEITKLDFIVISHNHYDHLDLTACKTLSKSHPQALFIVPLGLKSWFLRQGIENVEELDWWQKKEAAGCCFTALPGQHFSGRGVFDRNKTLWCGYSIRIFDKTVYFAGDTAYNEFYFREIGRQIAPIDLSILPIGCYAPRAFMKAAHVTPKEAIQIHIEVGSKCAVGCHYGTFCLSDEPMNRPPYDLYLALQELSTSCPFILLPHGGVLFF